MKQFYTAYKVLLAIALFGAFNYAYAQSPTTVTSSSTCTVVQNFNTTSGSFTSPSIYSDQYDYEFDWSGAGANGMMVSSSAATLAPYETSLISPIYPNTAPDGTVNVGFSYTAPAGTLYRIRVIRPNIATGGVDILAITSQGAPVVGGTTNWTALSSTSGTICLLLSDADLHPGQNLRYEFTFYVTSTGAPVTFDNFSLSSASAAPLPVRFVGIVANRVNNGISLRWDVGDEIDVQRYDVEKSTDAVTFHTIGSVNASKKPVYGLIDNDIKAQDLFYRIKSVDLDGTVRYSGIVRFKNNNSFSSQLLLYPSPTHSQLTIQHNKLSSSASLSILSMDGKVLRVVKPSIGLSNTMVDVSIFSPGMYVIKLNNGLGKIQASTFMKQ
jgi:hypothetical protein